MTNNEDDYVCTLSEASLKRACEELNEDPDQRLGAVETLRQWLMDSAPHLKVPLDTTYLLRYLRVAKFSQLRAREILEKYCYWKTKVPEWYTDVDPLNKAFQPIWDLGVFIPLPGTDKLGRKVYIVQEGVYANEGSKTYKNNLIQAFVCLFLWQMFDENIQVNGVVYLCDMSHFTAKHLTFWGNDDMKRFLSIWQGAMPLRFKAVHIYNYGAVLETMMAIFTPFLSKKLRERTHRHGNNLEKLYEVVPMEILPVEYLPDDYEGPNAGTMKSLIDKMKKEVTDPKVVEQIKYETHARFGLDESKRIVDVPQSSFRKLNID